jgi:AraC family transcriptional regulator
MDESTLRAGERLPALCRLDSADLGWDGVLCRVYSERPDVQEFRTAPTPDLGIVAVTQGAYVIESQRSTRWVSALYRPGSVGINLPHEASVLRWRAVAEEPMETVQVHLDSVLLSTSAEALELGRTVRRRASLDQDDPFVFEACRSLRRAIAAEVPSLYAETLAQGLAMHLLAGPGGPEEPGVSGGLSARSLARVVEYMNANLAQPITLERLANEVFLSKWHFLRQFKSATGYTPYTYLTTLRVERAKALLEAGRSASETARTCGFGSASQFSRTFRRLVGVSPSAYRS